MKRFNITILIFFLIILIGSGIYFYFLKRPKGKVFSSTTSFNSEIISKRNLIGFVSDRDGNNEIYLINDDGLFLRRITNTPQKEFGPEISYATRKLAYFSDENNFINIWLFSFDRDEKQLLSITRGMPRLLKFSPNGRFLALLEDSSEKKKSGDLFVINTQSGKTERVASEVENINWTSDSKSILYTQGGYSSIVQTRILIRVIDEENKLASALELFSGGVAPVFLSDSQKILFLDVKDEFLRLISMSLRGENQEELFGIKIRPQENTKYIMNVAPFKDEIILQIFSDQVLLESLIISLNEQTVKKLDLEANNLKWQESDNIVYNAKDQNGNFQLWVKEYPDSNTYQLTKEGNNWL